jgi:nucleotide-binding universal stress UspA family protein
MVTARTETLVVALSGAAETGAVVKTALGVAQLVGLGVEALHVAEDGGLGTDPGDEAQAAAGAAAQAAGLRFHHRSGPVVDRILDVMGSPRVFGAVMGTRAFIAGPRPAGSVALGVLRHSTKPVVFVPPEAAVAGRFSPRRLVVPLDGSAAASNAYLGVERLFRPDADREIVVVYTLDGLTPRMVDRPEYDLSVWGTEFVLRHCPGEHRSFEWRTGDPGSAVVDVAEQAAGDLVVLCFGGDLDLGHGAVVQEVLARSTIPVLVVPTPRVPSPRPSVTKVRGSAARP